MLQAPSSSDAKLLQNYQRKVFYVFFLAWIGKLIWYISDCILVTPVMREVKNLKSKALNLNKNDTRGEWERRVYHLFI